MKPAIHTDSPRGRGRRRLDEGPALDRERLVACLIELARTEGIDALNMRRVASELQVSPRLLYHHVRDKDAMIDLLADEMTGLAMPDLDTGGWEERLRSVVRNTRRTLGDFPGIPASVLSRSLRADTMPNARRVRAGVIAALGEAGLSEAEVEVALVQFSVIVLGSQIVRENLRGNEALAMPADRIDEAIDLGFELLLFGIRRLGKGQSALPPTA